MNALSGFKHKKKILIVNTSLNPTVFNYINSVKHSLKHSAAEVLHYKKVFQNPTLLDPFDGVIVSGQPVNDVSYTTSMVRKYYFWVTSIRVPVLGICGGHQVVGLAYGAKINVGDESERGGIYNVYVDDVKDKIFDRMTLDENNSFRAFSDHLDSITVPPGFKRLAHTDRCANIMMKKTGKRVYGVQFHPENPKHLGGLVRAGGVIINFEEIVSGHKKRLISKLDSRFAY